MEAFTWEDRPEGPSCIELRGWVMGLTYWEGPLNVPPSLGVSGTLNTNAYPLKIGNPLFTACDSVPSQLLP